MIKKSLFPSFMLMFLVFTGCIKETYNMKRLSDWMKYSPTLAMAAATGDISLSDIVKSNDTVIFDNDNFIRIVFKKDSVFDLAETDFHASKNIIGLNGDDKVQRDLKFFDPASDYTKGSPGQKIATFDPDTLDLKIEDILSNITGDLSIINPSIEITYSNSFSYPVEMNFNIKGKRKDLTTDLSLEPFTLAPTNPDVTASFKIDSSNSSLPVLMSMPPGMMFFSGTAVMDTSVKNNQKNNYVLGNNHLIGSIEIEVPIEFRMKNLQFTDTVDNFLKSKNSGDSPFKPEDMDLFRLDISAKNGFPLGASLKLILFDSTLNTGVDTIDATDIIKPAPIDANGKVTGKTETTTSIEFDKEFFEASKEADKIIFVFTLNTSGGGTKDVKIYSDYTISFKASVVVKPNLYLK